MKKNVMMRIASVLLICVLVTTCGISGTFAKYTTKATSADAARVAKWGVTVTGSLADANGMFTVSPEGNVVSSTTESVVAPGTSGTLTDFNISGKTEVAVEVKYDVTAFTLTGWLIDTIEYCPLIITVNTTKYYWGAALYTGVADTDSDGVISTIEEFQNSVIAAIEAENTNYAPQATVADENLIVSWEWEFEQNTVATQSDDNDTKLGKLAEAGSAPTINLEIDCIIDQVN